MNTEKLFEQDSHQTDCEARILACRPQGDVWAVVLDRTVFFPEGGGQPGDTGWIGEVPVTDTRESEGEILHLCDAPLKEGETVTAKLDWPVRLDHMQQHTGEHILSHAVWKLFGANNVGFHMGHDAVAIDLDRPLTDAQLEEAEDFANRQIWDNRPVRAYEIDPRSAKKISLRKTTEKAVELLRIVEVEGGDRCTCCGTHVRFTGEVGMIKVIRSESHKGGVRVYFLCGGRALADYRSKNRTVAQAGAALSAKEEAIVPRIGQIKDDLVRESTLLRERSAQLMRYKARALLDGAVCGENRRAVVAAEEELTGKEAKALLAKLTEEKDVAAAVFYPDGERLCWLIGGSADCRYLCELANGLFSGKGGGRADFAQGSGKLTAGWQDTALSMLVHMLR